MDRREYVNGVLACIGYNLQAAEMLDVSDYFLDTVLMMHSVAKVVTDAVATHATAHHLDDSVFVHRDVAVVKRWTGGEASYGIHSLRAENSTYVLYRLESGALLLPTDRERDKIHRKVTDDVYFLGMDPTTKACVVYEVNALDPAPDPKEFFEAAVQMMIDAAGGDARAQLEECKRAKAEVEARLATQIDLARVEAAKLSASEHDRMALWARLQESPDAAGGDARAQLEECKRAKAEVEARLATQIDIARVEAAKLHASEQDKVALVTRLQESRKRVEMLEIRLRDSHNASTGISTYAWNYGLPYKISPVESSTLSIRAQASRESLFSKNANVVYITGNLDYPVLAGHTFTGKNPTDDDKWPLFDDLASHFHKFGLLTIHDRTWPQAWLHGCVLANAKRFPLVVADKPLFVPDRVDVRMMEFPDDRVTLLSGADSASGSNEGTFRAVAADAELVDGAASRPSVVAYYIPNANVCQALLRAIHVMASSSRVVDALSLTPCCVLEPSLFTISPLYTGTSAPVGKRHKRAREAD